MLSIITRTKNRPLLLHRVLTSLQSQSRKEFEWIIVNDGGKKGVVDKIAEQARSFGLLVKLKHIEHSVGMEAASNIGISISERKYIVILDDDDTWEATFIDKTVSFLESNANYLGVVTQSNLIKEKVVGSKVHQLKKAPLNPHLYSIHIAQLAVENQFQTNAFVIRREVVNSVGGYDESMPVLGDWDFNLKVILLGEIGIIPELLANYHVREKSAEVAYGNTITSGVLKHHEIDAYYRNKKIRQDLKDNKMGVGHLLFYGKNIQGLSKDLDRLELVSDIFHLLYRFLSIFKLNTLFRKFKKYN